ncbi:MAG TPA: hypothetical protein VG734_01675 [Lacunisphaera sp.]|nr:hypothetical protein [Lacunisphaera sp.]
MVTLHRFGLLIAALIGAASCRLGSFDQDCVGECGGAGSIVSSSTECQACSDDTDCHSATELCFQGPGDDSMACHSDCSSSTAGCPSDYACTSVEVDGTERQVCLPLAGSCNDSIGGSCRPEDPPRNCERSNDWGKCRGHRSCLESSQRFDVCDASVPQCRGSCEQRDLPGCSTSVCASVLHEPEHCGACDNPCPGLEYRDTTQATCDGTTCGLRCLGSSYDVNDDASDGCELTDPAPGNHAAAQALDLGPLPCNIEADTVLISGSMASDTREHAITSGVDLSTGAAPDWYRLTSASRVWCDADLRLTLTVDETSDLRCYHLTAFTPGLTLSAECQTNDDGSCLLVVSRPASGTLHISVEKTCKGPTHDAATYVVGSHG